MTTVDKLQNIFQDVFDDPSIRLAPEFSPASYGDWDSVATVRLVLSIELAFGIRFTTDQVAGIKSVKEILSVLEPLDS
jgi:acyl carrier protein